MVIDNCVFDNSQFESGLSPSSSCVFRNAGIYDFIAVINNMAIFSCNLGQSYLFFQASYWACTFVLEDVRKLAFFDIKLIGCCLRLKPNLDEKIPLFN